MSFTVTVKDIFHQLSSAAVFVRNKYNLSSTLILSGEFEREFGIKVYVSGNILSYDDNVEFRSEADYLLFLLRWS